MKELGGEPTLPTEPQVPEKEEKNKNEETTEEETGENKDVEKSEVEKNENEKIWEEPQCVFHSKSLEALCAFIEEELGKTIHLQKNSSGNGYVIGTENDEGKIQYGGASQSSYVEEQDEEFIWKS